MTSAGSLSAAVVGLQSWARRRLLFTQTAGNVALNTATFVLNLALALLLSRLLGSSGYGAYAFAVALSSVLSVPGLLGMPALVVRKIASYRVEGEWGLIRGMIRRGTEATLVASFLVALGLFAAMAISGWPGHDLRRPTLLALPIVPFVALVAVRQATMQGFGRVVLGRFPETVVAPLLVILFVVALDAFGELTASSAVLASVAAFGVTAIAGTMLLRRTLPLSVKKAGPRFETRAWALAALPLLVSGGIGTLNAQIGTILVGSVNGPRQAGIFNVATRAAAFVPFFLLAAIPTLMPVIAELHARGEWERLQHLLTRAARGVLLVSLPAAAVLLVFATSVLRVFGTEFEDADSALRILVAGQLVNVATGFAGTILIMIGRSGLMTAGVVAGAAANVVLTSILVPPLGADGAAVGLASGVVISNLVMVVLLRSATRIYSPALGARRMV